MKKNGRFEHFGRFRAFGTFFGVCGHFRAFFQNVVKYLVGKLLNTAVSPTIVNFSDRRKISDGCTDGRKNFGRANDEKNSDEILMNEFRRKHFDEQNFGRTENFGTGGKNWTKNFSTKRIRRTHFRQFFFRRNIFGWEISALG